VTHDPAQRAEDEAPDAEAGGGEPQLGDELGQVGEDADHRQLLEAELLAHQRGRDEVDVLPQELGAVGDQQPADDLVMEQAGGDQRGGDQERGEQRRRGRQVDPEHGRDGVVVVLVALHDRRRQPEVGGLVEDREQPGRHRGHAVLIGGHPEGEDDQQRQDVEDADQRAGGADPGQPAADLDLHRRRR
jgi:hypothetical protein